MIQDRKQPSGAEITAEAYAAFDAWEKRVEEQVERLPEGSGFAAFWNTSSFAERSELYLIMCNEPH